MRESKRSNSFYPSPFHNLYHREVCLLSLNIVKPFGNQTQSPVLGLRLIFFDFCGSSSFPSTCCASATLTTLWVFGISYFLAVFSFTTTSPRVVFTMMPAIHDKTTAKVIKRNGIGKKINLLFSCQSQGISF